MKKSYALLVIVFCGIVLLGTAMTHFSSFAAPATDVDATSAEGAKNLQAVGYNPSASARVAAASRALLGERSLKDYHYKVHQNGASCQLCHSGEAPTSPPDDASCIRCHGTAEQMAQVTAKLERNPHKSPHYGLYAPCTSCHKEHKPSKVLCLDCHTFTFENFKK